MSRTFFSVGVDYNIGILTGILLGLNKFIEAQKESAISDLSLEIVEQVSRCRWQQSENESNKTFVLEKSHKNICPMTLTFFESLTGYFATKESCQRSM